MALRPQSCDVAKLVLLERFSSGCSLRRIDMRRVVVTLSWLVELAPQITVVSTAPAFTSSSLPGSSTLQTHRSQPRLHTYQPPSGRRPSTTPFPSLRLVWRLRRMRVCRPCSTGYQWTPLRPLDHRLERTRVPRMRATSWPDNTVASRPCARSSRLPRRQVVVAERVRTSTLKRRSRLR